MKLLYIVILLSWVFAITVNGRNVSTYNHEQIFIFNDSITVPDSLPQDTLRSDSIKSDILENTSVINDSISVDGMAISDSTSLDKSLALGQNRDSIASEPTPPIFAWSIDKRLGIRTPVVVDTMLYNYQQSTIVDGRGVAMGYTGNLLSPTFSKIFFENKETSDFGFLDKFNLFRKLPENHQFMNCKVPYTRLDYQRGGGYDTREELLFGRITKNIGPKFNFGADFDLIYARGFYKYQASKKMDLTLYSSFIDDRFESHLYVTKGSLTVTENGGITDDRFITSPHFFDSKIKSTDIPVRLNDTWNEIGSTLVHFNGLYNLGYYKKTASEEVKGDFVPVASLIFTSRYTRNNRRFISSDITSGINDDGAKSFAIDTLYQNVYINMFDSNDEGSMPALSVNDSTSFSSVKNTFAFAMKEGFKDWVKFGLTAFIENDIRTYSQYMDKKGGRGVYREHATSIGGELSKTKSEIFRYKLRGELGVLGVNLGDFRVDANVEAGFKIADKRAVLKAEGYIKNIRPKYLDRSFHSKYFWWDKEFGDTRRVYTGGKLIIPHTNTTLSLGVENIQNHLYFSDTKELTQEGQNIQVMSASIDQKLKLWLFHFDNHVVWQATSNSKVIPLPKLSLYSNLYFKTKIVNELTVQLGIDAHYHTKYYAQGYEPALMSFYNQHEVEIGDYPLSTVYANMHLKRVRFFLMYYNVGPKFINKPSYFSLPHYPVNPLSFKVGLSWNLGD